MTDSFLQYNYPTLNYIGNKEKIAEWICEHIPSGVTSFFDAFSGGSSVGFHAKKKGFQVDSNDIVKINYFIAKAIVENRDTILNDKDLELIFSGKPLCGFMYKNYRDRFYHSQECRELDQYRCNILKLPSEYKRAMAFTLLRRAMIRKMPYSRFTIPWSKIVQLRDEDYSYDKYGRRRAYHNLSFQHHFRENVQEYNRCVFDNGRRCKAHNENIFDIAEKVNGQLIYLDPPYPGTMNDYFRFYGVIDEFISGKKLRPFKNNFVDKVESLILFDKLFSRLDNFEYWMLSYNNSSYPTKDQLFEMISKYSRNIEIVERPHVYKITGAEKKRKNTEYLFIVKATRKLKQRRFF